MSDSQPPPDSFFLSEFGNGELGERLWRGGLRAGKSGYKTQRGIRSVSLALQDGLDIHLSDSAVDKMISDVETSWNDPARVRRTCSPILANSRHPSALSTSLVRIFLSIDLFQPPMITCVINKISEFAEDSCSDKDVAHALLNQLRWLDFIVDGAELCESLLSIVPVISSSMQKEVIETLPEILDGSSHGKAVTELIRILEESPSMMGSVVDALGALGVDDVRLPDVNSSILSTLAATNRDVLPVSIKYLLRSCPQTLLTETVNSLRNAIALPSLGPGAGKLCLDALKSGLRMSKAVAEHVIKTLRKLDKPMDHKPADLWILIALIDSPLHRKHAENIFRKKAANNIFSRSLIEAAIAPFADAFQDYNDHFISLASVALRSQEVGARKTGSFFFAVLFNLFSNGNVRRKLISRLLDHTGTRRLHETDAALESLVLIAQESEKNRFLLPHSALIQGLLDYLEFFNDFQLRKIWTILGFICRSATKEEKTLVTLNDNKAVSQNAKTTDFEETSGESELSMLQILLRKELTHTEMFYRRIGVIGACTMIKVLGSCVKNSILSLLLEVGRTHPFSQALAFDELAQLFGQGGSTAKETSEVIRATISNQFEKRYVRERSSMGLLVKDEVLLPAKFYGNLESDESQLCFSISLLIRNESNLSASQDAVRAMIPNLRLLCVMTANHFDGSLSEIDAVIGAPLHIPVHEKECDLENLNVRAKHDLLLSLFVAHGWLVELINAFAEQEILELRAKCVKRVDHLIHVTSMISTVISHVPNWFDVLFDSYSGSRGNPRGGQPSNVDTSIRRRAMKEKAGSSSIKSPKTRPASEWQAYARQLTPSAFSLLSITSPLTYRFTETNDDILREGKPVMETAVLSSKGLPFLVSHILQYLEKTVGGDLRHELPFGLPLFRIRTSNASKFEEHLYQSVKLEDNPLVKLKGLKAGLLSLGGQLRRNLSRIFPDDDELNFDDDTSSLDSYRQCVTLSLKCLTICLSSKVVCDSSTSQRFLFDLLASIKLEEGERIPIHPSEPFSDKDIAVAAEAAFDQMRIRFSNILNLDEDEVAGNYDLSGISLIELDGCCCFLAAMQSIFSHCSEKAQSSLGPKYSQLAMAVMKTKWDTSILRTKKTQKLIPGLVKIFVENAKTPLRSADFLREKIVSLSEMEAEQKKKAVDTQTKVQSQSESIGALTTQTVYVFTIAILEQYIFLFKKFQPDSFEKQDDAFKVILGFVEAELPLYTLARKNQSLLGPVMRAGRILVDSFLKTCLPFLKTNFMDYRSMVIQICKVHQKPTRLLQTLCAHSKFIRDTSLTSLVPPLRKSLELLLYRVKELLQANNATEAFQLGNLKHRDINGEVLGSQNLQYRSDTEESEYSTLFATDGDEDERDSKTARGSQALRNGSQRRSQRGGKNKSKVRSKLGSANKRQRESKTKTFNEEEERRKIAQDLDLGSDDETEEEARNEQPQAADEKNEARIEQSTRNRSKRRNVVRDDDDDDEGHGEAERPQKKRKDTYRRHALIDDEAAVSGESEEAGDEVEDMSQFLVFDEEEEDE